MKFKWLLGDGEKVVYRHNEQKHLAIMQYLDDETFV
jgi:hypothetical protein